jgi:hypothetical protein
VFRSRIFGGTKEHPKALHVEKRRFNAGKSALEFVANSKSTLAGIEPYNNRIDRNPDDNLIAVAEKNWGIRFLHITGGFGRETPVALRCCSSSADPDFPCLCSRAGQGRSLVEKEVPVGVIVTRGTHSSTGFLRGL